MRELGVPENYLPDLGPGEPPIQNGESLFPGEPTLTPPTGEGQPPFTMFQRDQGLPDTGPGQPAMQSEADWDTYAHKTEHGVAPAGPVGR